MVIFWTNKKLGQEIEKIVRKLETQMWYLGSDYSSESRERYVQNIRQIQEDINTVLIASKKLKNDATHEKIEEHIKQINVALDFISKGDRKSALKNLDYVKVGLEAAKTYTGSWYAKKHIKHWYNKK